VYRLPMVPVKAETRAKLQRLASELGLVRASAVA
jgi:phage terminase small subunit